MDEDLGLHVVVSIEWNQYIRGIIHYGVRISKREDQLVWSWKTAI